MILQHLGSAEVSKISQSVTKSGWQQIPSREAFLPCWFAWSSMRGYGCDEVLLYSSFLALFPRKQCMGKLVPHLDTPALSNLWTWLLGRNRQMNISYRKKVWNMISAVLLTTEDLHGGEGDADVGLQLVCWDETVPPSFELWRGVLSYGDVPLRKTTAKWNLLSGWERHSQSFLQYL